MGHVCKVKKWQEDRGYLSRKCNTNSGQPKFAPLSHALCLDQNNVAYQIQLLSLPGSALKVSLGVGRVVV